MTPPPPPPPPAAIATAEPFTLPQFGLRKPRQAKPQRAPRRREQLSSRTDRHTLPANARVSQGRVQTFTAAVVDRIVHRRMWIPALAVALGGIVFLQVATLKLNAGIGQSVQQASALERENQGLRAEIARLALGDRAQQLASKEGLIVPATGRISYLKSNVERDAKRAAENLKHGKSATAAPAADAGATVEDPALAAPSEEAVTAPEEQLADESAPAGGDQTAAAAEPAAPETQTVAQVPEPATGGGAAPAAR